MEEEKPSSGAGAGAAAAAAVVPATAAGAAAPATTAPAIPLPEPVEEDDEFEEFKEESAWRRVGAGWGELVLAGTCCQERVSCVVGAVCVR